MMRAFVLMAGAALFALAACSPAPEEAAPVPPAGATVNDTTRHEAGCCFGGSPDYRVWPVRRS